MTQTKLSLLGESIVALEERRSVAEGMRETHALAVRQQTHHEFLEVLEEGWGVSVDSLEYESPHAIYRDEGLTITYLRNEHSKDSPRNRALYGKPGEPSLQVECPDEDCRGYLYLPCPDLADVADQLEVVMSGWELGDMPVHKAIVSGGWHTRPGVLWHDFPPTQRDEPMTLYPEEKQIIRGLRGLLTGHPPETA